MHRRISVLLVALVLAACSGGGSNPSGSPTSTPKAASLAVALGAETALTTGDSFQVNVVVTNASGQVVTGQYASPVTLSTSDSTDTSFSSTNGGENAAASVTVTSSTQPVFLIYDGAALTTPVVLTASTANIASQQYTFTPSGTTPISSGGTISTVSVTANGAAPQIGSGGSFTLTVAGYSSTGALVTGTYANPITLTSNDSADLTFSVNGGNAAASATVAASTDIVVANYDGAAVPSGTTISASAAGVATVSVPFKPTTAGSTSVTSISKIALAQVGALPNQGTPGEFALAVTAYDANGLAISGAYPASVIVTTNDSTDLALATTAAGPFTPSVTVSSGTTVVYVQYGGGDVPQSTVFAANAGTTVQTTLAFDPAIRSTTALYINKLYVTTAGAPAFPSGTQAGYGSQPLYINAYDQNGNVFSGTYPSAVRVTLNSAAELDLSIGSYVPAVDCLSASAPVPCPNVAAQVVNNSGQVVFGNYTPNFQSAQISVTTSGIDCAAISFPFASGSTGYTCQAVNPSAPSSKKRSAAQGTRTSSWQLVPIVKN